MGKLTLYLSIATVLIAVFGFVFLVINRIPSDTEIRETARPLDNLPVDFFRDDNPLTAQLKELNIPGGVPVRLNQQNLGRPNVFIGF